MTLLKRRGPEYSTHNQRIYTYIASAPLKMSLLRNIRYILICHNLILNSDVRTGYAVAAYIGGQYPGACERLYKKCDLKTGELRSALRS